MEKNKIKWILREEPFGGLLINLNKGICKRISKIEFLSLSKKPNKQRRVIYLKKRGLTGKDLVSPITIKWGITRKCNLYCKTCYCEKKRKNELSKQEIFIVIDKLHSLGIPHIVFGGGEPFAKKDFLDIVDYATKSGFIIDIDTNGTLLNKTLIKSLKLIGVKRIDISLDGYNSKTNDFIRGNGTFKAIVNSIHQLKLQKLYVGVSVVVTSRNISELKKIVSLLNKLKVDEIHFLKFKLIGNGKKNNYLLPKEDWSSIREKIIKLRKEYLNLKIYAEESRCGTMFKTATILPEGDVTFCPLYDGIISFGNVKNEDFLRIWEKLLLENKHRNCDFCGDE